MSIRFFNTMTRSIEEFRPIEPGTVRLYTCGPTVYDVAHLGNFRTYMFEDLLRRHLKARGFRVIQVMNITDVEDKIIRKTVSSGRPLREVTEPFIQAFFEDLDRLNIERAEFYPRATDYVDEMVAMIRSLLSSGHAYRSEDGSIYYRISRFPAYGRLAHLKVSDLQAGARVAQDEYEKDLAADFALWKAWSPEDGEVAWDGYPDLGKGRPGWHIECSAMSRALLGDQFDIHTGGVDNIFPHHQNEIAQTEPCTGRTFVNYWLHSEHLQVQSQKMSKSSGNFLTLRDLLGSANPSGRAWDPMAIRYLLLKAHYRTRLDFTFPALEDAEKSLLGIHEALRHCERQEGEGSVPGEVEAVAAETTEAFGRALDEDLNMPEALAALHGLRRQVFRLGSMSRAAGQRLKEVFLELDAVLGLRLGQALEEVALGEDLLALLEERELARRSRDFVRADALREELRARGVSIEDTPQGVRWKIEARTR